MWSQLDSCLADLRFIHTLILIWILNTKTFQVKDWLANHKAFLHSNTVTYASVHPSFWYWYRSLSSQVMNSQTSKSEHLQNRSFPQPFDLSIHSTSKHQPKHLEIAKERPKRMPKSRRNIPFDKEMTVPSTSITRERYKNQEPPAKQKRADKEDDTKECSNKVPTPRRWLRMLVHIESPEIFQASKIHGFQNLISKKQLRF